jgi:iron complex transport system substrate-binding protein
MLAPSSRIAGAVLRGAQRARNYDRTVNGGPRAHRLAAAVAATVLLTATACGERSEPTGATAGVYPVTIVGGNDRPVTVLAPAQRIALLDRSLAATIVALGAADRIGGIPVDADGHVRGTALRGLHADIVVAPSQSSQRELSQAAAVSHAPVYVTPDTSIREVERAITQLGVITDEPTAARGFVRAIEQRRQDVAARIGDRARTTVFVDLGHFTGASDQTLIGDMVRVARGRNAADGAQDVSGIAALVRANPTVYVATSASGETLRSLRRNPRTRRLRAVRAGRVVVIDSRLLSPGPAIAAGLDRLAKALHPEALR